MNNNTIFERLILPKIFSNLNLMLQFTILALKLNFETIQFLLDLLKLKIIYLSNILLIVKITNNIDLIHLIIKTKINNNNIL